MKIKIIAAVAKNRAIGNENKLLYWLPSDLKRFKQLTTGHTIIMGRNTYLSLPKGALPNRRNIVLSTTVKELPGCDVYTSLNDALAHCKEDEEVYIIGGASVYEQALPLADTLCLTEIDATPEKADVYFPEYSGWHEVWSEAHTKDERHAENFRFVDYERDNAPDCADGECGVTDTTLPAEMEARVQKAVDYFMEGYNCSQSVVAAFADIYGMDKETALRASAGFGGGVGRMRMMCGAVSGTVILAGMAEGQTDGSDRQGKANCYKDVQQLVNAFAEENASVICAELLGMKNPPTKLSYMPSERNAEYYKKRPCAQKVESAARIFARYLYKNEK